MLKHLRWAVCLAVLGAVPLSADEVSHRAAAEQLLEMTGIEDQVERAYDNLRETMLSNFDSTGAPEEARPAYEKFIDEVLALLSKSLSWENTKDEYIDVFVQEFSEEELGRLIEFYETPLGRKTLQILPELYEKGAEIGQRRFEAVKPEIDALTDKMLDEVERIRRESGHGH